METKKKEPEASKEKLIESTNFNEKAFHKISLDMRFEAELIQCYTKLDQFDDNWAKASGLVYEQSWSHNMQVAIRELLEFETIIRDDHLKLLVPVNKLMHIPTRTLYTALTLIEALTSMIQVKKK